MEPREREREREGERGRDESRNVAMLSTKLSKYYACPTTIIGRKYHYYYF
jgi:hypothetical protein